MAHLCMKPSDAELLLLFVQQRSESAFRDIVERHQGLVYSICCRRLGDSDLAADATQNVFMALAANANKMEAGPLDGYLAKTAIYVCSVMRQARAARQRHESRYRMSNHEGYLPGVHEDERPAQLQRAMLHLSDRYREPLALRYLDGLTVEAVGVALDLSHNAVKKRLLRALSCLRQEMKAQGAVSSMAVVLTMLRRMPRPTPSADLVDRIVKSVSSSPSTSLARPANNVGSLVKRITLGAGAAATAAAVVSVALLPRAQSVPSASGVAKPVQPAPPTPGRDPLSFRQRLSRKLPDLIDQHGHFDFTLTALSATSHVPIEAHWDAIEAKGISRRTEIVLELRDKTLLEDLDSILARVAPPGILEYLISDGRIVVQPRGARSQPQALTLGR
jgi:RNA polymerase sigma factor (sigma-70 family)